MNTKQFQQKLIGLQDNMVSFALILTANREDAYDLTQDTTLKVLDNKDKFSDNINFKGWVLTVMRNIFINNYRKLVRTQTVFDQNANLYNLNVVGNTGFVSPESLYDLAEISNVIDCLPKDWKIPFSMYVSGYRYDEIAEKLGVPLGTVKSRIYYARKELQLKLKDYQ